MRSGSLKWARLLGYSTIWLARAAGPKRSKSSTPTAIRKREARDKTHFHHAGMAKRIRVQTGDALALVKKASGKFDIIFNDIDKHQYPDALRAALPKLSAAAC